MSKFSQIKTPAGSIKKTCSRFSIHQNLHCPIPRIIVTISTSFLNIPCWIAKRQLPTYLSTRLSYINNSKLPLSIYHPSILANDAV